MLIDARRERRHCINTMAQATADRESSSVELELTQEPGIVFLVTI
jgi:hypothetical protein